MANKSQRRGTQQSKRVFPPSSERPCPSLCLSQDIKLSRAARSSSLANPHLIWTWSVFFNKQPANKLALNTVCCSVIYNNDISYMLLPSKHQIQIRSKINISKQKGKQSSLGESLHDLQEGHVYFCILKFIT